MKKLAELREKRGTLMQSIGALADAENVTAEQLKEIERLSSELDSVKREIDILEKAEAIKAESIRSGAAGAPVSTGQNKDEKNLVKNFSLIRAINDKISGKELSGAEKEMHREAELEAAKSGNSLSGIGIAARFIQPHKRDLTVGTATAGGNTVQTNLDDFIPVLRPRMKVVELGARVLTGLNGNLSLRKQTAASVATWYAENGTASESDMATALVALTPKRLSAVTEISKQLLAQSSLDIESIARMDLETAIALAIDLAAINGSGASNQPRGILNTSGIGAVSTTGANGAVPTWANIVALESAIAAANADVENMAYLTTPGMRGALKGVSKVSGQNGFIWEGTTMNGYNAHVSTQVPNTLTEGTSSNCHAILFGDFSQLVLGSWAGIDIVADPYTKAKEAQVVLTVNSWWDVAVRYPQAFSAINDALPA